MSGSEIKPWDRFIGFVAESTRIFKAFSMALDAKKLMFAFVGVVVWGVGAMLINVFSQSVPWLIPVLAGVVGILIVFLAFARSEGDVASKKFVLTVIGSVLAIAVVVALLVWASVEGAGQRALLTNIYKVAWTLAAAAFFGTAVCRIAALDAATEETIGPRQASRFALNKLSTSIWTLLTPIIAVVAFGIVLLVLGFIARIPGLGHVWYTVIGVLYIMALLCGLFFAVTLLVYIPGLILFQPAIGAEGNDSFDAISRAYSFVFGRPWRLAFYAIVGGIYTKVVLSVVAVIFAWAGRITNVFLAQGIGGKMTAAKLDLGQAVFKMGYSVDPVNNVSNAAAYVKASVFGDPLFGPFLNAGRHILGGNIYESFKNAGHPGGWFIIFWQYILLAIFMAFAVSLLYSVFTQIYFLMRKTCDGTPFEEVYIETPEEEEYAAEFPEKRAEEEGESTEGAEADSEAQKSAPEPKKAKRKKKDVTDEPIDLAGGEKEQESGEEKG